MSDIFLSYANEDRERVRPLAEALRQAGWTVFWDRVIPVGKTWHDMLEGELENARSLLVVWSQDSIKSKWVRAEASEGLRRELPHFPVLLDDVLPPLEFREYQAADFSTWDASSTSPLFQNLVRDIKQTLGPPATPAPEPVEPKPPEFEPVKPEPSEPSPAEPSQTPSAEARLTPGKPRPRKLGWIIGGLVIVAGIILALTIGSLLRTPQESKRPPSPKPPDQVTKTEVERVKQPVPELSQIKLVTLPPPDFKKTPVVKVSQTAGVKLKQLSQEPNKITDDEAWFAQYNLSLPQLQVPNPFRQIAGNMPEFVPTKFQGLILIKAIKSGDRLLLIYGKNFSGGVILLAQNINSKKIEYGLDFSQYRLGPGTPDSSPSWLYQNIDYAQQIDDILYVSHGASGYARESQGRTGYVSAIEVNSMKPLWHSAPLVSNAANFELVGDYLVTGYGFTQEPDFLFLLRRRDGAAVEKIPLKSAPDYIIRRGDRLYVRTYNTNYIFQIVQ